MRPLLYPIWIRDAIIRFRTFVSESERSRARFDEGRKRIRGLGRGKLEKDRGGEIRNKNKRGGVKGERWRMKEALVQRQGCR